MAIKAKTSSGDPVRKALPGVSGEDPPSDELMKGTHSTSKPSGVTKRSWLKILGPGLITGASDDDPSGIGTYSQVGSQYGLGLLWTAAFTFPLMCAIQELCARIALQTGTGLGVTLRKRFPTWLVGICILSMVIANVINLGADLSAVASGGELLSRGHISARWLVLPVGLLILGLQLYTSYAVIFKVFKYLTVALFGYVATALISHPTFIKTLVATIVPHIEISAGFITAVVAVLGTTISPYLFIWQASSEVDEMKASGAVTREQRRGVSTEDMKAARADIIAGMAFSQIVMYCIMLSSATALNSRGVTNIQSAQQAATAMQPLLGQAAFVAFSIGMIGAGLLAIPILSNSAAYAVKEFTGLHGNLAMKPRYRPTFYAIIVIAMLLGIGMNFVGIDPIKALFVSAVINGVVAPPFLIFITLLGSDRKIMQEQTSGRLSTSLCWAGTGVMTVATVAMLLTIALSHTSS